MPCVKHKRIHPLDTATAPCSGCMMLWHVAASQCSSAGSSNGIWHSAIQWIGMQPPSQSQRLCSQQEPMRQWSSCCSKSRRHSTMSCAKGVNSGAPCLPFGVWHNPVSCRVPECGWRNETCRSVLVSACCCVRCSSKWFVSMSNLIKSAEPLYAGAHCKSMRRKTPHTMCADWSWGLFQGNQSAPSARNRSSTLVHPNLVSSPLMQRARACSNVLPFVSRPRQRALRAQWSGRDHGGGGGGWSTPGTMRYWKRSSQNGTVENGTG